MVTNYHSNIRYICIFRLKLLLFSQKIDQTERKYSSLPGNTTKIQSIKQSNTQQLVKCKSSGARGESQTLLFSQLLPAARKWFECTTTTKKSEDSYSVTLLSQQASLDSSSVRMPRKLKQPFQSEVNSSIISYFSIRAPACFPPHHKEDLQTQEILLFNCHN